LETANPYEQSEGTWWTLQMTGFSQCTSSASRISLGAWLQLATSCCHIDVLVRLDTFDIIWYSEIMAHLSIFWQWVKVLLL
jgi:hypothetical protein